MVGVCWMSEAGGNVELYNHNSGEQKTLAGNRNTLSLFPVAVAATAINVRRLPKIISGGSSPE